MTHVTSRVLRRLHQEDGAAATYLAGALTVVLVIAFALMLPLGDAAADRRTANTGADAAALAAADSCIDHIEDAVDAASLETAAAGFWSHFSSPISVMCADSSAVARHYASLNGTTLTGASSNTRLLTFSTSVSENSGVARTTAYETSDAEAEIVMDSGVCTEMGFVGVTVAGICVTAEEGLAAAAETGDVPPPMPVVSIRSRLTDS